MLKINSCYQADQIPDDWRDRTVKIWEEDDVPYPGKEQTSQAFERITGRRCDSPVKTIDTRDETVQFFRSGWVKAVNCEGGWIGKLTV